MFDNTNPYYLQIHADENTKRYYAAFVDEEGKKIEVEISVAVAKLLFQTFVRKERNLRRSDERNLEHSELNEQILYQRALHKPESLEDTAFLNLQKEKLWRAIDTLPKIQRRRLILYYFEGFTYEQIAKIEGCSFRAIKYSVDCAKENLKKYFQK
ncbi:RNA polymerase sigma factor [Inediibacterium massiliense]|uniref:RNA polymerase sigma factor n=1 Tax=Inediibacterium massiliense TaxID=1658111 RepID=UPI0006B50A3E|nr:sigma-70 family RNA polymerase sigma factor [Inediibacterium massiliense]